jgi:hypothetical protein
LWNEVEASRKRHKRQEETTNRILQFLAGVFGTGATGDMANGTGASVPTTAGGGGGGVGTAGTGGVGGIGGEVDGLLGSVVGKGKGKEQGAGTGGVGGKRRTVVVPRNKKRLLRIGDGTVGLDGSLSAGEDGSEEMEEIELPYADDEGIEEIGSSTFASFLISKPIIRERKELTFHLLF